MMGPIVRQLWDDNYRVYGARKVWKATRRAGHDIGRDQVARLMRTAGPLKCGTCREYRSPGTVGEPTAGTLIVGLIVGGGSKLSQRKGARPGA